MALASRNEMAETSTMSNQELDTTILELLASRICHDLISPVGAVHNGVEFLEEMGAENGAEAITLIAHSASMATSRLQAFRLAYGAGGRDPNIKPEDVHKTFADLIQGDGKVTQEWDPYGDLGYGDDRPEGFCKMLMGALMLAMEALPKGGNISVSAGERKTIISAKGEDALVRDQVDAALARTISTSNLDPRLVHPFALSVLAHSYNFSIEVAEIAAGHVEYTLSYHG